LEGFDVSGGGESKDRLDVGGEGSDAGGGDVVAQEIGGGGGKGGLGSVDVKTVVGKGGENLVKVLEVLLGGGAEDKDVIQVYENERKGVEKGVHEALKGLGSIAEAERHEKEFKKAERGNDGGFADVGRVHGDLVVALLEVDFGENGGAMELRGKVVEVGQGVFVWGGVVVEEAIIAAGSGGAVRLGNHVEGGGPGCGGTANDT